MLEQRRLGASNVTPFNGRDDDGHCVNRLVSFYDDVTRSEIRLKLSKLRFSEIFSGNLPVNARYMLSSIILDYV